MTSRNAGLALAGAAVLTAASIGSSFTAQAQDGPGGGPSSVEVSAEGQQIYEQICQACHMADAKGGGEAGALIPALANNPRMSDPAYPTIILLKGRGGMPWFTDMLSEAQMAAVITYVRTKFNTYPEPVTEAFVKKLKVDSPPVPDCNCTQ